MVKLIEFESYLQKYDFITGCIEYENIIDNKKLNQKYSPQQWYDCFQYLQ